MLREWTQMRLNSQITAPLLGALIVTAACLGPSQAHDLNADDFVKDVRGKALSVVDAPFAAVAHVFEDGTVEVQSAIGIWQGSWASFGETMCIFFDEGPQMGETCVTIQRMAGGGYRTSSGTRLVPVASAMRVYN
ncbi:MAG: hypothetical protein AAF092_00100 [Pseudomonadota bacterium]